MRALTDHAIRLTLLGAATMTTLTVACRQIVGFPDDLRIVPAAATDAGDAGEAGADASECRPGLEVQPTDTFDSLNTDPRAICNAGAAGLEDDHPAGLDRFDDTATGVASLDGRDVTSCVAAEFAGDLASVTVRARSTPNACGEPCLVSLCGTGHIAGVFAGPTRQSLRYVGDLALTGAYRSTVFDLPPTTRVVAVCRQANGTARDDVEVDDVRGTCSPAR